jgi:carbon storage regulator CsrA
MLVLTRHAGERILIHDTEGKQLASITITAMTAGKVKIGIEAEPCIKIDREEVFRAKQLNPVAK